MIIIVSGVVLTDDSEAAVAVVVLSVAEVIAVLSSVTVLSVVLLSFPLQEEKRKTKAIPRVDKNFNCFTV